MSAETAPEQPIRPSPRTRDELCGQGAAALLHDLANILTGIIGRTQLLMMQGLEPTATRTLQTVEQGARDAGDLVHRLRAIHTSENSAAAPQDSLSINELVEYALQIGDGRSQGDDRPAIEIVRNLASLPSARGNPADLRGAITNIVVNAVEAMPEGGTLKATTSHRGARIYIEISDTGAGIPQHLVGRVFEVHFSTKAGDGRGLGLCAARDTISSHGGTLDVSSEPGRGTIVTIALPVPPVQAAMPDDRGVKVPQTATVLVIESEGLPLARVANMLVSEGHRVTACRTMLEGLSELATNDYNLLIAGVSVPGDDSCCVLKAIRSISPRTKVIALAGWQEPRSACATATHPGADFVVPSPVFPVELRAVVSQALAASG